MRKIAIIPARAGSKGLPDKNIKEFMGKPLIYWTIQAALDSQLFDEVMVSTDSDKYAEIAIQCGAEVPFLRSPKNASDVAGTWDTVREVILEYSCRGKEFDAFCLLQPTSPLRTSEDIKNAMSIFEEKKADAVVSLCELEHSISICNTLEDDNCLNGFFDSNGSGRRQEMEKYYRINGAIYIQKVEKLLQKENLYGNKSYAYIMEKLNSIDIDDEFDFIQAEALAKHARMKLGALKGECGK